MLVVISFGCGGGSGSATSEAIRESGGSTTLATAPKVSSTSPISDAADVAITSVITVTFDSNMDSATINADTFLVTLKNSGSSVTASSITYDSVTKTAVFTPISLDYSTQYTVTITTGVKDIGGTALESDYSWNIQTVDPTNPPDTPPEIVKPQVVAVTPADGSIGAPLNSTITVTFNKDINPSTINCVFVNDGTANIDGRFGYASKVITFTPSFELSNYKHYTVTVQKEVEDLSGNQMLDDYVWSFDTVDAMLPSVSSTSPANLATGVSLNSTIRVTFSNDMDPATITGENLIISDGITNIDGDIVYLNKVATFTPSQNLADFTHYVVTVKKEVGKLLSGNHMAGDYIFSFDTEDTIAPTITSVSPADGTTNVGLTIPNISATFDKNMDSTSLTVTSFTLSSVSGGVVSYNSDLKMGFLSIPAPLDMLTEYTATVKSTVKDSHGIHLADNYTWSFTTSDGSWQYGSGSVLSPSFSGAVATGLSFDVDPNGSALVAWINDGNVYLNRYLNGTWSDTSAPLQYTMDGGAKSYLKVSNGENGLWLITWVTDGALYLGKCTISSSADICINAGDAVTLVNDVGVSSMPDVVGRANGVVITYLNDNKVYSSLCFTEANPDSCVATVNVSDGVGTDLAVYDMPKIIASSSGKSAVVFLCNDRIISLVSRRINWMLPTVVNPEYDVLDDAGFGDAAWPVVTNMPDLSYSLLAWQGSAGVNLAKWDPASGDYGSWSFYDSMGTGTPQYPAVKSAGNNKAIVAWYDDSDKTMKASIFNGTSWSPEVTVGDGVGVTMYIPSAVIDANGNAMVVYVLSDGVTVKGARYISSSNTWFSPVTIGANNYIANLPAVSMDSKGRSFAVWSTVSGPSYTIMGNVFK